MQMLDHVHIELISTIIRHNTELGEADQEGSVREGEHHTIMAEQKETKNMSVSRAPKGPRSEPLKKMSVSRAPKGPRSEPPRGNTSAAFSLNSLIREGEHHTIMVGASSKNPQAKVVLITNPADKAETPKTQTQSQMSN